MRIIPILALALLSASSDAQDSTPKIHKQDPVSVSGARWSIALGTSGYFAAPVQITNLQGPSPSFIPKWQKGWGLDLALGRSIGMHGRFLFRGIWDRIPLGYATDAEPKDHPLSGLPYPDESLNLTDWYRRISVGIAYRFGWDFSRTAKFELGVALLRNVDDNDYTSSTHDFVVTDATVIHILDLQTKVFAGNSPWHGRGELQYTQRVHGNHAVTLAYYVDLPFSDVYTQGRAVLMGNTQYRTTLNFHQSGFIQGLSLGYEYGWRTDWKKIANGKRLGQEAVQERSPLIHRISISLSRSATPPITVYDQTGPDRSIKLDWAKCDNLILDYSYHFKDQHRSFVGALGNAEIYLPHSTVDIPGYTTPDGVEGRGIHQHRFWVLDGIFHFNLLAGRTATLGKSTALEYYVGAGIVESSLTSGLAGWYENVDTTHINYGGANVDLGDEHLMAPSGRIGGDVIWSWGWHGSFSLGALAVVTGRYISGGYTILPDTPRESTGKFKGTLSYIGIRAGYGFRWGMRKPARGKTGTTGE